MSQTPTHKTVTVASGFRLGVMPTPDGEKVILIVHPDQPDEIALSLDPRIARDLGRGLAQAAETVLARGSDEPPTRN